MPQDGFEGPNYTQTPNEFLDEMLPRIKSLSELKVTLAIIRRTFGWHTQEATLSLSLLERLTGLSRESVAEGVRLGMERGTIGRRPRGNGFDYSLIVKNSDQSRKLTGQESRPKSVKNPDRQVVKNSDQIKEREKERKPTAAQPLASQPGAGGDEQQRIVWHREGMRYLEERCGPIPDGAAQGKALKWLLQHFTLDQCKECLDALLADSWRTSRISWLTVRGEIGSRLARKEMKNADDGRFKESGRRDQAEAGRRQTTREERIRADLLGLSEQVSFTGTASALDG